MVKICCILILVNMFTISGAMANVHNKHEVDQDNLEVVRKTIKADISHEHVIGRDNGNTYRNDVDDIGAILKRLLKVKRIRGKSLKAAKTKKWSCSICDFSKYHGHKG